MKKNNYLLVFLLMMAMIAGCGNKKSPSTEELEKQIAELQAQVDATKEGDVDADAGQNDETADSALAATIVTNQGETVEMTAQELMDVYDSNEAAFEKKYKGAKISFVGTVKKIEINTDYYPEAGKVCSNSGGDTIAFEEGWTLIISERNNYGYLDMTLRNRIEHILDMKLEKSGKEYHEATRWLMHEMDRLSCKKKVYVL